MYFKGLLPTGNFVYSTQADFTGSTVTLRCEINETLYVVSVNDLEVSFNDSTVWHKYRNLQKLLK